MKMSLMILLSLGFCQPAGHLSRVETEQARDLIRQHGCGSCHVVPDMPAPQGNTGPSLADQGRKAYVAGVLPNTPTMLAAFIHDPKRMNPPTAMPDLGVTTTDAQLIAAYLLDRGGAP